VKTQLKGIAISWLIIIAYAILLFVEMPFDLKVAYNTVLLLVFLLPFYFGTVYPIWKNYRLVLSF
jgi:hypothetical protein